MDDLHQDFQEENDQQNGTLGDYADYFDCYNDDLDPDQQDIEFWNQF